MRKRREIKRERILAYYILAIVFPCLILGILAFRGIKNDQALVERDHRNNLAEAIQDIIQQTDAYLTAIENSFKELTDSISPPQKRIFTDSLLNHFIDQYQTVTGIFFISDEGIPKLLNNALVYVPDHATTGLDPTDLITDRHSLLDKGWQFEFKEKNYRKALEYYQSILLGVHNEQSGGETMNAIARIQKKLGLNDKAIKTYDLIWRKYPDVFIQNRIPLGAAALLEKSFLDLNNSDSVSALQNIQLLLSQIRKSTWGIGYSYYTFLLSQTEEIISGCEISNNEEIKQLLKNIKSIEDSIYTLQTHTEYLLTFLGSSSGINLIEREAIPVNSFRRYNAQINTKSYFWSLSETNDNGNWGLLINTDYLTKNTIQPLILEKADESNFFWEVMDENGGILLQSELIPEAILPVYTVFPSNLPALSVKCYPEDSGILASMLYSREGLFFYIFIVIIIILGFGLYFTLRTINNELHFSKMKSYFMSTVSHEFKSPLTSIRQMAEMLVRGRVPSGERKKQYYNMMLLQSERLSHLIENILDFSKMEDDQKVFHFEKDNIVPLVKDAVTTFNNNTVEQGFQINLSNGESIPDVLFDKEAMEQVMHNLLDNACKYSGDSRNVEVEIAEKGKNVVISVTDFGVGISKKDKDKIFDRFYRVGDELTQSVKGSGIGLTIVKQIVAAHKGDIVVESNPGKGSTFSIILPIA